MAMSRAASTSGLAPVPRTRLFGREAGRGAARAFLLDEAAPLLTLTGPGGVGKTRLALAIADDVSAAFADGVVWVDLASLRDASLVGHAIATALGVVLTTDDSPRDALIQALRTRQILLLLDNCEHVLVAIVELATDLLAHCPTLQLLATSRAPLQIAGEQRFDVDPLPLPNPMEPFAELAQNDAVRLFSDRARLVHPAFALDATNAPAVGQLCRQLDGLPLAIELAAAWTSTLPPQDLLAQMSSRLPWLHGGPRDLPARQSTVRDTIAWSYDLLDAPAQQLFRGLSIFVGGFTLEAAQRVMSGVGRTDVDVLSGVRGLLDQGLVRRAGPDDIPRFMMLETIREFGLEQLAASQEADIIGSAHASCFLTFAEHLHPNRVSRQERVEDRVQRLEQDLGNFRAALAWFDHRGETQHLLRLTAALAVFWHLRTHFREGRSWIERALAIAAHEPTLSRGQALAALSLLLWAQSHYVQATAAAQAGLAIARVRQDKELAASALHVLGMIAEIQDNWAEAARHLTDACMLWHEVGATAEEGWALTLLCRVSAGQGNRVLAAQQADQALTLFDEVGHPIGSATARSRLAEIARGRGDDHRAADAFREALGIYSEHGERWLITLPLAGLADLAAAHNQATVAATLVGFLDAWSEQTGAPLLSAAKLTQVRAASVAAALLDDPRFKRLRDVGRTLSLAEAVGIAAGVTILDRRGQSVQGTMALTKREMEIFRLLARMHTDQDIATVLSISRRTVSGHVTHILTKLDVETRRAAVVRGRELGLLE